MQLLFINNIFPQPSQTFVLDQIRFAREQGVGVTVFAKRYNTRFAADYCADVAGLTIHDRPRNAATMRRLARGIARAPERLGSYLRQRRRLGLHLSDLVCALQVENRPDVIVANFGQNGLVAARITQAFFPDARLAVIFHGYDLTAHVAAHGWDAYRRAAPAIDMAIAVNRPLAGLLRANVPLRQVAVHHLGVDLRRIPYRTRREVGPRFSILFVGRMVEKKGFRVLLDAALALKARGHNIAVHAVGDGPEEQTLRARAIETGLGDTVTFYGSRPHDFVLRLMGESDCLALPSVTAADGDQEGIPVTLMEAMAAGLPVVSTWHSGIPELVTDGETGLLVAERSPVALADALERLISETGLGLRLADNARQFVATGFNAEIQNRALFDLILGAPGPNRTAPDPARDLGPVGLRRWR